MIRPKQLLPLYKGARTWLVAGTTCGARPNGSDGSAGNAQYDEGKPNQNRVAGKLKFEDVNNKSDSFVQVKTKDVYFRPSTVDPLAKPIPFTGSNEGPLEGDALTKKRARVGEGRVKTSPVSSAPLGTHLGVNEVLRGNNACAPVSQQAGPSGAAGRGLHSVAPLDGSNRVKAGFTGGDGLSIASTCGGKEVATERSSVQAAFRGPSLKNTAYVVAADHPSEETSSLGNLSCLEKNPSILVHTKGTDVGEGLASAGCRSEQTPPAQVTCAVQEPVGDKSEGSNQTGVVKAVGHPSSLGEVSVGSTKGQKPLKASPHLDRTGGSNVRGSQLQGTGIKSTKVSRGSKVDQVCSILRESRRGLSVTAALDQLKARLTSHQVNEVLKNQNEVDVAFKFFEWVKEDASCKHDVHSYTTMLGLLGRARSFEAMELLFQEMQEGGVKPSVVTFNRLIFSYGKASRLSEALDVFHYMQKVGCAPDRVTYCTLIDVHAKGGFYDIAMQMYKQMLQAGLHPDTFTYSVIVNCLGKAGKLNAAHKLYQEMLDRGCTPNIVTHNIILDLHSKAGNWHLAMKHYNDMQDAGFQPNKVTYSIMMEVLGNSGHIQEAEHVIHEMELGGWELDTPIYGLIIDMWGKAGNAEKACMWHRRMLDAGLMTNVQICNSLGSTFLRLNDYDAAKDLLSGMPKMGLVPTLQTYTLLLSCCTMCKEQKHLDTVLHLLGSTGHPAHSFLCTLLKEELEAEGLRACVETFFTSLRSDGPECRRKFADALIDFFHKLQNRAEAGCVWEVARANHLFPNAVKERDISHWSINLHVMSMGTALTAMSKTLTSFGETMLKTGRVPDRVDIITGWGKRSKVTGASLVKQAVEGTLTRLGSPFKIQDANVGLFVSQGPPLYEWLHQPEVAVKLAL